MQCNHDYDGISNVVKAAAADRSEETRCSIFGEAMTPFLISFTDSKEVTVQVRTLGCYISML